LAELHPSDRLMVRLIQIDRLGPRIEGMLYKCAFDETWSLLHDVSVLLKVLVRYLSFHIGCKKTSGCGSIVAPCQVFQGAIECKQFALTSLVLLMKCRPQLILLIGNYMNGTGIKGGAFGFRVSSINKVCYLLALLLNHLKCRECTAC
jgi:cytokinesis protein